MAELLGQTIVIIGGSSGIDLETARRARSEGADVVLTGRDADRVRRAALDVGARSTDIMKHRDDRGDVHIDGGQQFTSS